MHPIINNLSLIADAAEYFDKQTSAAWRIRASMTNMLVWGASGLLYAMRGDDSERIHRERIKLATMRCWMRDCNASAFVLDLTAPAIRRTLGLDRDVNPHDEAVRVARGKCLSARSAVRFAEHYKAALLALEERRARREAEVSDIEDLLQSTGFVLDGEVHDARGYPTLYENEFVADEQLYDDDVVLDQLDRFSETLGNMLESMYSECDRQLNSAIITHKIARLTGYKAAIEEMMKVVGVDTRALAKRQVALEAQIAAQADLAKVDADKINTALESEIAALAAPVEPIVTGQPRRASLDYNERMAQATSAAQARAAEDKQADAAKAKRSAAARKAAETRAANRATAHA